MFHIAHAEPKAPINPAVEAAATWLDGIAPGWAHRINLDTLDIGCAAHCVLGQVFADEAAAHYRAAFGDAPVYSYAGTGYHYGRALMYVQGGGMFGETAVFASNEHLRDWYHVILNRRETFTVPLPKKVPAPAWVGELVEA